MSLALKLMLSPLLVGQAMATRRRALVLPEADGPREGRLGPRDGRAIHPNVSHISVDLDLTADVMAEDGFHPGEPVYRICGEAFALHIATTVWPALKARAAV